MGLTKSENPEKSGENNNLHFISDKSRRNHIPDLVSLSDIHVFTLSESLCMEAILCLQFRGRVTESKLLKRQDN